MLKNAFFFIIQTMIVACGDSNILSTAASSTSNQLIFENHFEKKLHNNLSWYGLDLYVNGNLFPNILMDTGSSNTILLGNEKLCPTCQKAVDEFIMDGTGGLFSPLEGQKPLLDGTQFGIGYGDNNFSADGVFVFYEEELSLEKGSGIFSYPIGVFTEANSVYNIIGLSYSDPFDVLANNSEFSHTFLDNVIKVNNLPNAFSVNLCMDPRENSFIVFGGVDDRISINQFSYTPLTSVPGKYVRSGDSHQDYRFFYNVSPLNIKLPGGTLFSLPDVGAGYQYIIDTGSSILTLPLPVLTALQNYYADPQKVSLPIRKEFWDVLEFNSSDPSLTSINEEQYKQLNSFYIEFPDEKGSFFVEVTPSTYAYPYQASNGEIRYLSNLSGPLQQTSDNSFYETSMSIVVLGIPFLQNVYTFIDRDNNKVGFLNNSGLCSINS